MLVAKAYNIDSVCWRKLIFCALTCYFDPLTCAALLSLKSAIKSEVIIKRIQNAFFFKVSITKIKYVFMCVCMCVCVYTSLLSRRTSWHSATKQNLTCHPIGFDSGCPQDIQWIDEPFMSVKQKKKKWIISMRNEKRRWGLHGSITTTAGPKSVSLSS